MHIRLQSLARPPAAAAAEVPADRLGPDPALGLDDRPATLWPRRRADVLIGLLGAGVALALLGATQSFASGVFAALWWWAVVVIVKSDLDGFVIPDQASLAIAFLGLASVGVTAGLLAPDAASVGEALAGALANGIAAFGLFWCVGVSYRRWNGHDGLGFGDVKLAGASAIWLAPGDGVVALEIAAIAALVVALASPRRGPVRAIAIPFGAFLAPAAWLTFVAGPGLHAVLDP